jgi:purine nucleoside permease
VLVDKAFALTSSVVLPDNSEAESERAKYPGQKGKKPTVLKCDTLTGDDFFSGKTQSDKARYIMGVRTESKGNYCSTQMEDNATATALRAHGYLDRYITLRTISNFDQPYPGQSVVEHLKRSAGLQLAIDNAYMLGRTVADEFLRNPPLE